MNSLRKLWERIAGMLARLFAPPIDPTAPPPQADAVPPREGTRLPENVIPESAVPDVQPAAPVDLPAVAEDTVLKAAPETVLLHAPIQEAPVAQAAEPELARIPEPAPVVAPAVIFPDAAVAPQPGEWSAPVPVIKNEIPVPQEPADEEPGDTAETAASDEDCTPVARKRSPRVAPSRESFEAETAGDGFAVLGDGYLRLNRALARSCLLSGEAGKKAYLAVTPRVLAGVLEENCRRIEPAEAERLLAEASASTYRVRVLADARRLSALRRFDKDGVPECIAFLTVSVLAAYRMHTDSEMTGNAYYKRLCGLLGCELAGNLPRGFDPEEFEGLWIFVEAWLRRQGRELAMPGPEAGVRKFVALPLCHVPLRQLDIDRLPDFFHWAGYETGENVPSARIEVDFGRWMQKGPLTAPGAAAWADLRRGAVLAQTRQELGCWDGTVVDSQGRNWAPVEILLDRQQRVPVLSFMARRPAGFPAVFADPKLTLEAGQEGWYEPVALQKEDGALLASGIQWQAGSGGKTFVLGRQMAAVTALIPCEYAGYLSHHGLMSAARCAVLCTDAQAAGVAAYLEAITGSRCAPAGGSNCPDGWKLFIDMKPVRRIVPPAGLENLEVLSSGQIFLRGGLRLGRQASWLAGAPPEIHVAGFKPEDVLNLNGAPVTVDDNGRAEVQELLAAPGSYEVEIAGVRRRFDIGEAALPVFENRTAERRWAVALPAGTWTVLGSIHGRLEIFRSEPGEPAILARVGFEPVWAVACGPTGRGARVICFGHPAKPPAAIAARYRPDGSARRWADSIFSANIRRPQVALEGGGTGGDVVRRWGEYVAAAREIKRRIRRARR